MQRERDVAVVLSGGGMNGVLMELGFLQRLRDDPLWERVGWIYGTSAGALAGMMAAVDRLDDLEGFLLSLEPGEAFRPHRLWQLPLTGLHDYTLPETIAARVGDPTSLATDLAGAPIELVVCVTDVGTPDAGDDEHPFERVYSSRTSEPEVMGQAILASAAISALVLPVRVGDVVATDGGWVRNFPLAHAYHNPAVREIVGFRFVARYPTSSGENLQRLRRHLEPFRAVPPVRALIAELDAAEERQARGEPPHLPDMLVRLMRVAIARNTELEVRRAQEIDGSIAELDSLRADVVELTRRNAPWWRRRRAVADVEARFARAHFPFGPERRLPTTIVHGDPGERALDPSFRPGLEWPVDAKRDLIGLGRELADRALSRAST